MKTLQKHAINNKYDYYENIKIMVSFSDFVLWLAQWKPLVMD